jgi:hypothetical protein
MKHEVSLDLLYEMAECIHSCSWNSEEEVYAYMKSCVTGDDSYDPEDWKGKETMCRTIEIFD